MKRVLVEKFFGLKLPDHFDQIEAEVDSRKVKPGAVFFALKGLKTDGHLFLSEAIEHGAILIVAERIPFEKESSIPIFITDNTLQTLQDLAAFHFQYLDAFTIAVTGSYGKSTTKEFIAHLLSGFYRVGKTEGNQNSQIGLALSLIRLMGEENCLVLEMGMSSPGEIRKLVEIAPPDVGVLTAIGTNHIAQFGSLEAIADEKSDLFSHSKTKEAILEAHTLKYPIVRKKIQGQLTVYSAQDSINQRQLVYEDFVFPIDLMSFKQEHFIQNLLPALILAKKRGLSNSEIEKKIQTLDTLEHRFQSISKKRCLIIDDAYNSSLESMKLACETLRQQKVQGKKIAVIGAFSETGDFEEEHHQKLAEILAGHFHQIFCIGEPTQITVKNLKSQGYSAVYCASLDEIIEALNQELQFNDLLFLKGANRYRLWEIVNQI